MTTNQDKNEQPRDPLGKWKDKPGTNSASCVSLASESDWPPSEHTIHDPEFQHLTWPLPHLDGAVVEYEDGTRASMRVSRPRNSTAAQVSLINGSGDVLPAYDRDARPCRIVAYNGSNTRLQDELELTARRQALNEAYGAEEMTREATLNLFSENDKGFLQGPMSVREVQGDAYLSLPYQNANGDKAGEFVYCEESGKVLLRQGSDQTSQRFQRLAKVVKTEEFASTAREHIHAVRSTDFYRKFVVAQLRCLEDSYGRRYA